MSNKPIKSLYELYKNTPKKLKIICDWDEVIQACEPYALYLGITRENSSKSFTPIEFSEYFGIFWKTKSPEYSFYGSKLGDDVSSPYFIENQQIYKNSPNFYQQAPFLTITEDLLKLIKEDKVEKLIFLSAYDKRKFPNGDDRKWEIFDNTFQHFDRDFIDEDGKRTQQFVKLKLIPFESETQGQSKADWIKQNASDFDIVIDDNPNICESLVENLEKREDIVFEHSGKDYDKTVLHPKPITVITPYYPAMANQHHSEVLLVKNEVSDLKKKDFGK